MKHFYWLRNLSPLALLSGFVALFVAFVPLSAVGQTAQEFELAQSNSDAHPAEVWLNKFFKQNLGVTIGTAKNKPKHDEDLPKTPRKKIGAVENIALPILKQMAGPRKMINPRPPIPGAKVDPTQRGKKIDVGKKPKDALKAALPLPPPLTKWDNADIVAARRLCNSVLQGVDVTVKPVLPMRMNTCGTPAPLKVSALLAVTGAKVSVTPAATLNCAFTARLAKWVKNDLQPLALKHLSTRVKMIHNVASYSCRRRYNDPSKKISEHAKANALDIAGFTLENDQVVSVLKHWSDETAPQKQAFLKAVHQSACRNFVVVLGPEANEAHKNHFHFDLGRYPVCE